MNNHNELDQIVESFLQPKKSTTLGMKELFALFEEVERLNEIQIKISKKVKQSLEVKKKGLPLSHQNKGYVI